MLYVTASQERAEINPYCVALAKIPLVLYDAHYAETDPARRQLNERARLAGVRIEPIIEVEYLHSALALVQEGIDDTIACSAATKSEMWLHDLHAISFDVPMYA